MSDVLPLIMSKLEYGHVIVLNGCDVSKKKADDEAEWETEERSRRRCIWVTGRSGLTEHKAAEMIIQEAKKLLADDLQQMGVDWKPTDNPPGMLWKI